MKTTLIELEETHESIPKYKANGKRITRSQYWEVKRRAARQDSFQTINTNGSRISYSSAYLIEPDFVEILKQCTNT